MRELAKVYQHAELGILITMVYGAYRRPTVGNRHRRLRASVRIGYCDSVSSLKGHSPNAAIAASLRGLPHLLAAFTAGPQLANPASGPCHTAGGHSHHAHSVVETEDISATESLPVPLVTIHAHTIPPTATRISTCEQSQENITRNPLHGFR